MEDQREIKVAEQKHEAKKEENREAKKEENREERKDEKPHNCAKFACVECHKPSLSLHALPSDLNNYLCKYVKKIHLVITETYLGKTQRFGINEPYTVPNATEDSFAGRLVSYKIRCGKTTKWRFQIYMTDLYEIVLDPGLFDLTVQNFKNKEQKQTVLVLDKPESERIVCAITKSYGYITFTTYESHTTRFKEEKYLEVFTQMLEDIHKRMVFMKSILNKKD